MKFLLTSLSLVVLPLQVQAALSVTNFMITSTTVTFDISGDIDSGAAIGSGSRFQLYLGVPGDTDWITSNSFSPTVVNNGGGNVNLAAGTGLSNDSNTRGDNLQIQKSGAPTSFWAAGDIVDASVTFTGTYIPANLNIADLIVAAGNDGTPTSTLPDSNFQVGTINTIPEPSTGLMGCIAMVCLLRRRR